MVKKIVVIQGVIVLFLVLALSTIFYWYQHRSHPEQVIADITAPKITPNEKILIPDTLKIDFGRLDQGNLIPQSVAPLAMIGKPITNDLTMTPETPGEWRWESDSHLVFTPKNDWPAEQTYWIHFNKKTFSQQANMARYNYQFKTLPFEQAITEFKFYQDPSHPQLRQVVATISFSYPVNPSSLPEHIALTWQATRAPIRYTLNYDEHKRSAYLHSEAITLPEKESFITLSLSKGIQAAIGNARTQHASSSTVLIPDASNYFKVKEINTTIVRNSNNQPEQVLTIETTSVATDAAMQAGLHAYLLPNDTPTSATVPAMKNIQWRDVGQITPAILALAKPIALQSIPSDQAYTSLHSYRLSVPSGKYLYVKLDQGTPGFANDMLAHAYESIVKVAPYPQEISFLHQGALLALGTEEKLSVLVRGIPAVKFSIARILPDDINHLVTQTEGEFNHPYFINASFNQNNISEIFTKVQTFAVNDPAKLQYTTLDLSEFMAATKATPHPLGLFLLQAQGFDPQTKKELGARVNRLVLITDLGLIAKDNADDTHDVFIASIKTGTPIKNVAVSILAKNGLALLTRTTDANGHAHFPTVADFKDDQEPVAYLVKNNNDVAFMPFHRADRQLNYSRFDIGGITTQGGQQTPLTAYVFSDRGIYRPGDTAHIAMIVKQGYLLPAIPGVPLSATIVDPRGVTVKEQSFTLNDTGFFTLDFKTQPTAASGEYQVNLYIVKDHQVSNLIGSTTLSVAEFLPDQLRIQAHLTPPANKGWLSPANVHARVALQNLYGTPAAQHKISTKLLLSPKSLSFKEFPDYLFMDPLLHPQSPPPVLNEDLGATETNAEGVADIDLNLQRFPEATYELTVWIEGFAKEGGRSVTTQTKALISPLPYFVGYKANGELNFILQHSKHSVEVIAINRELKTISLSGLTMTVYKEEPLNSLVKLPDGTFQYQSIMQSKEIKATSIAIPSQGLEIALNTQQIGDFNVIITQQDGKEISRFRYKVVGNSNEALPQQATLEATLNKLEYAPKEEISIQIKAPYTGSGLITIERDKVYAAKWFKTSTTSTQQSITIPEQLQGNAYVNIAFIRDLNSPDIYKSPLSYSVLPFTMTHHAQEMQISLQAPTLAKPGDNLSIAYQTDQAAKIIIFGVDEGILQVSQYQTPDPLAFFFQKQALEVTTQQLLDQIMPAYVALRERAAIGGGAGEAAALLNKNLNPFKRKTESPIAFWSGVLDSDSVPKQYIYHIPDYFNGSLRVMAVAVSNKAASHQSITTEVRGDFIITPNVPTFVAPGDQFTVTASIANNLKGSGKEAKVDIQLSSSKELAIKNASKQTIIIPEGEERSIRFQLKAKENLGSATLQWITRINEHVSHLNTTLSVRPLTPYQTNIISGYAHADKTVTFNQQFYPDFYKMNAYQATSPLLFVMGLQQYLNNYPYGCTEQLVSKSFPLLAMAHQPWLGENDKNINDKIQQMIEALGERQMSSGGFDYWPGILSTQNNEFASIYAMHFLTEAKIQGYPVPQDLFVAGIGYLKEVAGKEIISLNDARLAAYAIYLLTRNEMITTNYVTHLQLSLDKQFANKWHKDITAVYLAATYQLLKSKGEADKLISDYQPLQTDSIETTDFYNRDIASAEYLYLLAKHFPQRLPDLDEKLIMSLVTSLNHDSLNTVLSSYASLALTAYGQATYATTPAFEEIPITNTNDAITFKHRDQQPYFYQFIQSGFDKTRPPSVIQQGLEVYREFHDASDKITNNVLLGDELTVHLRVRATDERYHDNVVIVDLLPGGFEVVRSSINALNQTIDYADAREDRVLFFGSVGPESKEIIYKIKATNTGEFNVPPIFAVAMYYPMIKSLGVASFIRVVEGKNNG